jgi:NADPH:quinone reductase-like Zn-dependent oxidoreductase
VIEGLIRSESKVARNGEGSDMKAVRIHAFGGPEVLQLDDIDIPEPREDEVLIRVHAASVNPIDYKIRAGSYPPVKAQHLPKILGRDVAGTIERCGSAVTRWREGDFESALHDVDLVFDLVGGDTQERSWEVLKDGGTLISTLMSPSEEKAREHHAHAQSYVAQPNAAELAEIGRLIDADRVHPHVHAVYSLAEAAEAHRALEHGHVRGKVVLKLVP